MEIVELPAGRWAFGLRKDKLRQVRRRERRYLLRSNLSQEDPGRLWQFYIQLTQVEAAFKDLKDDLPPVETLEAIWGILTHAPPRPPPRAAECPPELHTGPWLFVPTFAITLICVLCLRDDDFQNQRLAVRNE